MARVGQKAPLWCGELEDAGHWAGTLLWAAVPCWDHPVQEGEGTLLGPGTAKALEHPWRAAGATSTQRKGLAVPCRAFQVCPTWKSCSDAAPIWWGPCRALWDTQRAHGMTGDKGWSHVCHELTLVPQQHQFDQCRVHHAAVGAILALLIFFPIPSSSYTGRTQLHPPKTGTSLFLPPSRGHRSAPGPAAIQRAASEFNTINNP